MRRGLAGFVTAPFAALAVMAAVTNPTDLFTDAAKESGLDFTHRNGMSGRFYMVEMMGPGGALFDYDNDGDLDVFLPQGQPLEAGRPKADASDRSFQGKLYRNDLTTRADGTKLLRFHDVTAESGIRANGYGMGVVAADFNNDGWIDLYLTNFGHNQLWLNRGRGATGVVTFRDATAESGADDERWSTSATAFDADRDGWLDLFVGNYIDFSAASHHECFKHYAKVPDYCSPLSYHPVPDRLFRNSGSPITVAAAHAAGAAGVAGTAVAMAFEDVTAKSKISTATGGALGVIAADFNEDGWPDLFVANDGRPSHLWVNQRDGTFKNDALVAGCALSPDGKAEAGMGVDAGDADGDGHLDLYVTHLLGEANRLYGNDGRGNFDDRTIARGLSGRQPYTGFGTGWIDFDKDGWLDLFVANGAVTTLDEQVRRGDPFPLRQPAQLFRSVAGRRYEDLPARAGAAFRKEDVARGAAFGDIDNDGDTDILVVNNNGPVRLLINNAPAARPWLGVRMVADPAKSGSLRDMPGTKVGLVLSDGRRLWRHAHSDGSYLSSSDPRVLFGFSPASGSESAPTVVRIVATWPDGREDEWTAVPSGRYTTLIEGSGQPKIKPEPATSSGSNPEPNSGSNRESRQ